MLYTDLTADNRACVRLIQDGAARILNVGQAALPFESGTYKFTIAIPKRTDAVAVLFRVFDSTNEEVKAEVKLSAGSVSIADNDSPSISASGLDGWLANSGQSVVYEFTVDLPVPDGEWVLYISTAGGSAPTPIEFDNFTVELVSITDSSIGSEDFSGMTRRTTTGTDETLVLADAFGMVTTNNAAPVSFNIPPAATLAYPLDKPVALLSLGAGVTSVVPGAGVLVNGANDPIALDGQFATATLYPYGTDLWSLSGKLA